MSRCLAAIALAVVRRLGAAPLEAARDEVFFAVLRVEVRDVVFFCRVLAKTGAPSVLGNRSGIRAAEDRIPETAERSGLARVRFSVGTRRSSCKALTIGQIIASEALEPQAGNARLGGTNPAIVASGIQKLIVTTGTCRNPISRELPRSRSRGLAREASHHDWLKTTFPAASAEATAVREPSDSLPGTSRWAHENDTQTLRRGFMVTRLIGCACLAAAIAVVFAGPSTCQAWEGKGQRVISYQHKHDLFANYYVGPQPSGQAAQMYISPRPVPASVGHTYTTYQPLMPHEYMYKHMRTHYAYTPGAGWNRAKVRYGTAGLRLQDWGHRLNWRY